MKKFLIIFILFITTLLSANLSVFAFDFKEPNALKGVINKNNTLNKKTLWAKIKGKPSQDALNLGMFSYHTMRTRDELNESHKLISADYKGYTLGTFNNSYHVQTYYAGITRQIYQKQLPGNNTLQLKYKLIAMYGYKDFEPDVFGITPNIIPVIGLSTKYGGIDFLISPGKTATFATNFRINLDTFKSSQ